MVTLVEAGEIASRLPGTVVSPDGRAFSVPLKGKLKGYAWTWNEKIDPKRPKVPNVGVLAVIVRNLSEKEIILGSDSAKFFTEPHYNNFPAVLVRLDAIAAEELEDLLTEAWLCKAPPALAKELERG